MRVLSILLPAYLANDDATSATVDPSEFKIIHCNNPDTLKAEMKIEVSKTFLFRNGGLDEAWATGFEEEATGVYTKIVQAADLELDNESNDPDGKFFALLRIM